jgi:dTDP-4-dehydrorhamnose 3,5-epimerase
MLEVRELGLDGVVEIVPKKFGDDRGFFSETFNAQRFTENGIPLEFCQDNHSLSRDRGVLRGLHYQLPPRAQDKLVRVSRGAIFDVVVDIRQGSPTFGKWVGVEISAGKWNQVLVPKGFAHGFVTLVPDTEVQYKVTEYYSAEHDRGVRYDDPAIGIEWPIEVEAITLSEKDSAAPLLADAELGFTYSSGE